MTPSLPGSQREPFRSQIGAVKEVDTGHNDAVVKNINTLTTTLNLCPKTGM